jgi:hypothetical protein
MAPFPQMSRIADLSSILVDQEIDGLLGPALHYDAIVSGGLQRDSPGASQVAVAEMLRVRGRRFPANLPPRAAKSGEAGERPGEEVTRFSGSRRRDETSSQ